MSATHARVTNSNEFTIEDRYDGVPVVFEPGVAKTIPLEAAALFFGFRVEDDGTVEFTVDWGYFARRHGWTNMERLRDEPMNDMVKRVTADSAAKCAKVKVEPIEMRLREVALGEEELPPPREAADPDQPQSNEAEEPRRARRGNVTVG